MPFKDNQRMIDDNHKTPGEYRAAEPPYTCPVVDDLKGWMMQLYTIAKKSDMPDHLAARCRMYLDSMLTHAEIVRNANVGIRRWGSDAVDAYVKLYYEAHAAQDHYIEVIEKLTKRLAAKDKKLKALKPAKPKGKVISLKSKNKKSKAA